MVTNSYSSCSVTGEDQNIGGLVGTNSSSSIISNSYSTGEVGGEQYLGGLVGENRNSAIISNSYCHGNVTRVNNTNLTVGGFVGVNDAATIEYSYSIGDVNGVTGTSYGFIGWDKNGTGIFASNFFDYIASNRDSPGAGATSKSTSDMKTEATYTDAGWDFTNTWEFDGVVGSYPSIQANAAPTPVELTSFIATSTSSATVVLKWTTATEVNNYGFDVESKRASTDDWRIIGFVEGHGNSNSPKNYSFVVSTSSENDIFFRLKQIDTDGAFEYSDVVTVEMELSKNFKLGQNYPNPFNPTTSIAFTLPTNGFVTLKVYNIIGEEVAELLNKNIEAGNHNVIFNALNLPTGAYFYRIISDNFSETKKMLLIK